MIRDDHLILLAWHQRATSLDARERLLARLVPASGRALLTTCHRVEVYAVANGPRSLLASLPLDDEDRRTACVQSDAEALAHLFAVTAGLDSAVAGEPQILAQVRRAYRGHEGLHPLIATAFERALHVGRLVRHASGLEGARSVGSLAVDAAIARLAAPERATALVIGAGEMGTLAVRALARRVGTVIVANRDTERARALADAHGASAIALADVAAALDRCDAVISAADTRGELLTAELLAPRLRSPRPLVVIDIAVPRSLDATARDALDGSYLSVDDLPGAAARADGATLRTAGRRCELEAERFFHERAPASLAAIRALRERADRLRAAKLERALHRLGHLSPRDRRVVEALSTTLTNALLHEPTVALRQRRADPDAARALFERGRE